MTKTRPPAQRARSTEQKALRREQYLKAAARVFDAHPWTEITVSAVAREAGLAKGSSYRYFSSKEALFTQLLVQELGEWCNEVEERKRPGSRKKTARAIVRPLLKRARLLRLLPLTFASLEAGLDDAATLDYRRALLELGDRFGEWVEGAASLPSGSGLAVFLRIHALLVGLLPLTHPPEKALGAAVTDPELGHLHPDPAEELELAVRSLLRA